MENLNEVKIVEGIYKGCNWRERIIIRLNKRLFMKVYHIGRTEGVSAILK